MNLPAVCSMPGFVISWKPRPAIISMASGCLLTSSNIDSFSFNTLPMILHTPHGLANCYALTVVEDIYPEQYREFMTMLERQGIDLPKGLCQNLTDAQYDGLYEASIVHEKPLSNCLGPDFRNILTRENVIARFKRM